MAHRPLVEVVGHRKRSTNGAWQRYTVFVDQEAVTGNHRYLSLGLQNVGLSLYAIAIRLAELQFLDGDLGDIGLNDMSLSLMRNPRSRSTESCLMIMNGTFTWLFTHSAGDAFSGLFFVRNLPPLGKSSPTSTRLTSFFVRNSTRLDCRVPEKLNIL